MRESTILTALIRETMVTMALVGALACTRSPTSRPGPGPHDGGVSGSDAYAVPAQLAGNGVPIPPVDPSTICDHLVTGVEPCTGPCAPVTCDCGGTPLELSFVTCSGGLCLKSVSCTTACALSPDEAGAKAFICLYDGLCTSSGDCQQPGARCLIAPGATRGQCTTGGTGAACFTDSDCASSACVAAADGSRSCADGVIGAPCNTDRNCQSRHCALPAGVFAGACTDGDTNSPCLSKADCMPLLDCIPFGGGHVCTTHGPGAFCESHGQCNGGFCVSGKCTTGQAGSSCEDKDQCHTKTCVNMKCTTGDAGDACFVDNDCQSHCSNDFAGGLGRCTNGELGQHCPCVVGLHCNGVGTNGVCAALTLTGGSCRMDSDCASQKCSGPEPLGLCTEGKVLQGCRDGSQCEPGLHCSSDGLRGTCLADADAGAGG